MASETQYTANTGMVTISTANTSLTGSGTLSSTIITGASNGTFLKTVTVKAQGNTTQGMVRLFLIYVPDEAVIKLFKEIEIPAVTQSPTDPAFEITVPLNFTLKSGWFLKASTEKGETFNVIIEGQDWVYYGASVRSETTKYTTNNAVAVVSTANSATNGTGSISTCLTSSGCNILSLTVKATVSTTAGMIRFFLYDGTNTKMLTEVPVQAVTQSAKAKTFSHKVFFDNTFALKSGWSLKATTEIGENFNIICEFLDWSYPA